MSKIKVPYLLPDRIRQISEEFLEKHNPDGKLPVPIENIVDCALKIDIVPIPELESELGIPGALSPDMSSIYIDEWTYNNQEYRSRFTIAHELGHLILHKDLMQKINPVTISEWKIIYDNIDLKEFDSMRWQANTFAGFVLVPTPPLVSCFRQACNELLKHEKNMPDFNQEILIPYVAHTLSGKFEVSEISISYRIINEKLFDLAATHYNNGNKDWFNTS